MRQAIFYIIIAVLLFSIYGSYDLSKVDFIRKNICPKIISIPACYIVLLFFTLALFSHILPNTFSSNWWYFGFITIPLLLAISGTATELSGTVICPRTSGGTPMCYISLAICSVLIILKITEHKLI